MFVTENLLPIGIRKIAKPVYLGLSILELSKIVMCGFWYDMDSQNIVNKQKCTIQIQTVSLYT